MSTWRYTPKISPMAPHVYEAAPVTPKPTTRRDAHRREDEAVPLLGLGRLVDESLGGQLGGGRAVCFVGDSTGWYRTAGQIGIMIVP